MTIGEMRHRVTLQRLVEQPDGNVGITPTYEDIATVWADVETVTGLVYFDGRQTEGATSYRITIRYRSDITSEQWVLYDGRRLRIRSVVNLKVRKRFLILDCEEAFLDGAYEP